jgi:hypothetical protein
MNCLFIDLVFEYLQVADCDTREFTDQKRLEMSVTEFVEQWTNKDSIEESVLYLKDWHFVKEYPDYTAYQTPPLFSDDWLNVYLDNYQMHEDRDSFQKYDQISCSDYRFVYMGGKGLSKRSKKLFVLLFV